MFSLIESCWENPEGKKYKVEVKNFFFYSLLFPILAWTLELSAEIAIRGSMTMGVTQQVWAKHWDLLDQEVSTVQGTDTGCGLRVYHLELHLLDKPCPSSSLAVLYEWSQHSPNAERKYWREGKMRHACEQIHWNLHHYVSTLNPSAIRGLSTMATWDLIQLGNTG